MGKIGDERAVEPLKLGLEIIKSIGGYQCSIRGWHNGIQEGIKRRITTSLISVL